MRVHEQERLRGFRLGEALDPFLPQEGLGEVDETELSYLHTLSAEEYQLFCGLFHQRTADDAPILNEVELVDSISHGCSSYATESSIRFRDSGILFQPLFGGEEAGVIRRIFLHRHRTSSGELLKGKYLVMQQFKKKPASDDPYQRYGHAGGFGCELSLGGHVVLGIESIICHVGITSFHEDDYMHVLPINRVSKFLLLRSGTALTTSKFLLSYELGWLGGPRAASSEDEPNSGDATSRAEL
jgi:hypothetical protein